MSWTRLGGLVIMPHSRAMACAVSLKSPVTWGPSPLAILLGGQKFVALTMNRRIPALRRMRTTSGISLRLTKSKSSFLRGLWATYWWIDNSNKTNQGQIRSCMFQNFRLKVTRWMRGPKNTVWQDLAGQKQNAFPLARPIVFDPFNNSSSIVIETAGGSIFVREKGTARNQNLGCTFDVEKSVRT